VAPGLLTVLAHMDQPHQDAADHLLFNRIHGG
jgi:hypothetical protein